jgi:hypothetical protein
VLVEHIVDLHEELDMGMHLVVGADVADAIVGGLT